MKRYAQKAAAALLALLILAVSAGCDIQLREMADLPDPDAETAAADNAAETTDTSAGIISVGEDGWFSSLGGFWLADDGRSAALRFAEEGFSEW